MVRENHSYGWSIYSDYYSKNPGVTGTMEGGDRQDDFFKKCSNYRFRTVIVY